MRVCIRLHAREAIKDGDDFYGHPHCVRRPRRCRSSVRRPLAAGANPSRRSLTTPRTDHRAGVRTTWGQLETPQVATSAIAGLASPAVRWLERRVPGREWSQGRDSNLRYTVLQFAPIRPNPCQLVPFCHALYLRRRPSSQPVTLRPAVSRAVRRQNGGIEACISYRRDPDNGQCFAVSAEPAPVLSNRLQTRAIRV